MDLFCDISYKNIACQIKENEYTDYVMKDIHNFAQKNVDDNYKEVVNYYKLMCKNL